MADIEPATQAPVIFLHGASSAGKTTLAQALLPQLPRPFWHLSIDHLRDAGVWHVPAWRTERAAHFAGFHGMIRAVVEAGNAVLLEHILDTADMRRQVRQALAGQDVFFAAVLTARDCLAAREAARGDRPHGSAVADAAHIHIGQRYDLELDGCRPADHNAQTLLARWQQRSPEFSIFRRRDLMPARLSDSPFVHPDCEITASTLGAYTEVGRGSRLNHVEMDDYSYCDRFADIANARIGKFANIASYARIGPTDHPMELASLHHFHYRSDDYWEDASRDPDFFARRHARIAHIGHDTWIGHNAVIRPEVTVGHGAVVATGAVVTKDVAPYTVVAGLPATPLKQRLPAPVADRLMALEWWEWDHDTLRARLEDFRSLPAEAFLEKYEAA